MNLDMIREAVKAPPTILFDFLAFALAGFPVGLPGDEDSKTKTTTSAGLPLGKLLLLNGKQIFGGKFKLTGEDRFEVAFDEQGEPVKGFTGDGVLDQESPAVVGGNRLFIIKEVKDGVEILYPALAGAGISKPDGSWSLWSSSP